MDTNNKSSKDSIELTDEDKKRYNRQIILSEVGEIGHKNIKNSKIIVIGAGGLGSSCLMHLAGTGVGKICIVDNDIVEEANLHRQIIHNMNNLGMNKALSAKKFINALNPLIDVVAIEKTLTNKEGVDICKNYDIIVDCCDNPKTRYLINDIAVILNKPLISAATVRWDGQIGVYVKNCLGEKLPCYRCLNPKAPLKGSVKKCAQVGVIGTLPGLIGTLEANEAIKFILGKNDQILQKKIILYDGFDNKIKVMKTRNAKDDCIVCGKNPCININNIQNYDYQAFIDGLI